MIIKSFVLRRGSYKRIVDLCDDNTVAVVRPAITAEDLFRSLITEIIDEKQSGLKECQAILDYFYGFSEEEMYRRKIAKSLNSIIVYLSSGVSLYLQKRAIEDFILDKCALLCAEAVSMGVPGSIVVNGNELVVCRNEQNKPVFDWDLSRKAIAEKCGNLKKVIVSGGYGRLDSGYVVRIGKGGANMLASLISSALGAESVEFYINSHGINGLHSMTYDEAAHFCASSSAPFSSAAIWPAKNAGIPIMVKSIDDLDFPGTLISSSDDNEGSLGLISGVIADKDLVLVTIYGTGLLGQVGITSSIMSCIARAGVNIRFIAQTSSEYSISIAVKTDDCSIVSAALKELTKDNSMMPLDDVMILNRSVGIVTVYGSRIKNVPGVSGRIFSILGDSGINVIASAQGGEELSVSVVLENKDVEKSVELLNGLKN